MKDKLKKVLKYAIIVAIVVGIGFGVKGIFFPTPKPIEAYNNLVSVLNNDTYAQLKQSNSQILTLINDTQSSEDKSVILNKYETCIAVFESFDNLSENYKSVLVFANNNSVYNKNTRKIKKQVKKLNKVFEKANSYLDNYYQPFYEQTVSKDYTNVLSYANAVFNYNVEVIDIYHQIIEHCQTICKGLGISYCNSDYILTKNDIVIAWTSILTSRFDQTNSLQSLTDCKKCSQDISVENAISFYSTQDYVATLENIKSFDFVSLLQNINTDNWDSYYGSLSAEAQQNANKVIDFIKNA